MESVKVFKALGDPTRLRIFRLLLERSLCVCELIFVLKMEQSRISHHLQILREAGLVEDKREGRWMIYGIPAGRREGFDAFLKAALRDDRESYRTFRRDLAELDICLREDIRGQRCAPAPATSLPPEIDELKTRPRGVAAAKARAKGTIPAKG